MPKFREKPVAPAEIEAWRWHPVGGHRPGTAPVPRWLLDALKMTGAPNTTPGMVMRIGSDLHIGMADGAVLIAETGDWVVRNAEGAIYPLTNDALQRAYDPV